MTEALHGRWLIGALFGLLMFSLSTAAFAQTPAALATPDLKLYTNGVVRASVRQADGSVIIGGRFSQVNGVARAYNVARLNPDGSLDPKWDPQIANYYPSSVYALALDGNGNVYIGYVVGVIYRASGSGIGLVDATWFGGVGVNLFALAVDHAGNVYSGHDLCCDTERLLAANGAIDPTWSVSVKGAVYALAIDSNDNLYIGGDFPEVNDVPRQGLAKVSTSGSGTVDATWNPAMSSYPYIDALVLDGKGNLYVGGAFTAIGSQSHLNIAKVSTTGEGAVDANWNPSANGGVRTLAVDASDRVYVGGGFSQINGQARTRLARLASDGSADAGWIASTDALPDNVVYTISVGTDAVYAGGLFSVINGEQRHSVVSLDANATLLHAADAVFPGGKVRAMAAQPNGGVIVAGQFSGAGGFVANNLLRLNPDGTPDTSWVAPVSSAALVGVQALAVDSTNRVYIGGDFKDVAGQSRFGLARINATGTVDPDWGSAASLSSDDIYSYGAAVTALGLGPDGSVFVSGSFGILGELKRQGLAKVSTQGIVDPLWDPNQQGVVPYPVMALAVDASGAVYCGTKKFSSIGTGEPYPTWDPSGQLSFGQGYGVGGVSSLLLDNAGHLFVGNTIPGVSKLSVSDGSVDASWTGGNLFGSVAQNYLSGAGLQYPLGGAALALNGAGDLFIGGAFVQAGNRTRPFLAKVAANGTGTMDLGWNPTADAEVKALLVRPNGQLYVGGLFTQVGSTPLGGFAAITTSANANPVIPDHLDQFGWTGAWYDPTTTGQGILLQAIPSTDVTAPGTLFGGWFTYDDGTFQPANQHRWYTMQGPIDNTSKSAGLGIYATGSGVIGHNGPVSIPVGSALLSFADCTHATLTISMLDEPVGPNYPNVQVGYPLAPYPVFGAINLVRLGSNITCSPKGDLPDDPSYSLSGAWYDPANSGQGFMFDVDPVDKVFFAAWYTFGSSIPDNAFQVPWAPPLPYDPTIQRWYTLQTSFSVGQTTLDAVPIYETAGGVFTTPTPITSTQVGTAKVVFANCDSATLDYTFSAGEKTGQSGTINLSRGPGKPANCNP